MVEGFNPVAELLAMENSQVTDALLIDLHIRQMRSQGLSPNTLTARSGALRRLRVYLDPDGENPRAIIDATAVELVTYQASLELAPKSILEYISNLQLFYEWLIRPMRVIKESPATDLARPTVKRRMPRPIPEDDLAYAIDACTDRDVRTWMILGAYAGLRSVDVSGLRRDDPILSGDIPMLRVLGKGGNEDLVAVGKEVIEVLAPYLGNGSGPIFRTYNGKAVSPARIQRAVNDYLRRIGLPYTFHQFRHRYGTKVYLITRDIRFTQRQMRHSSVASTEKYAAIPGDKAASSVAELDKELAARAAVRGRRR